MLYCFLFFYFSKILGNSIMQSEANQYQKSQNFQGLLHKSDYDDLLQEILNESITLLIRYRK